MTTEETRTIWRGSTRSLTLSRLSFAFRLVRSHGAVNLGACVLPVCLVVRGGIVGEEEPESREILPRTIVFRTIHRRGVSPETEPRHIVVRHGFNG